MLDVQLDEVNQAAAEEKAPEFGVHLDIASYGDMSSFFWAHSQAPPPGLIECNVAYGERHLPVIMLLSPECHSQYALLQVSVYKFPKSCIFVTGDESGWTSKS